LNHDPTAVGEDPLPLIPEAVGEHRLPLSFVGSGSEYFRIWIVNLLLTLVTLGLYYPFAKVRRLRYFHGATEVGGHPLSFHADPWKMLRGYLLVVVLFAAYGVAGQFSPVAGLVAFCIIAALWPALWHSSLRFRLANTGWRGLRLHFTGSRGGAYRALAPGFALALVLVAGTALLPAEGVEPGTPAQALGPGFWLVGLLPLLMALATPALLWLMRRYQQGHLALGAEETRFEVGMGRFYGLGLRVLGLTMLAAFVAGLLAALLAFGSGMGGNAGGAGEPPSVANLLFMLVPVLVVFVVFQAAIGPYFISRLQNLVWNGTRSAHLRFESALRFRALAALTLRNWLLIVITLGLYFPFAAIATARLRLQAVALVSTLHPDALFSQVERMSESAAGDAAADIAGIDLGL